MMRTSRRRIAFTLTLAFSVALASCSSILGIQDLERETSDASPASGSGGASGIGGGTAGRTSSGGASTGGGSTGAGGAQGGSFGAAGDAMGSGGSPIDASADGRAGTGGTGTGGMPDSGSPDAKTDGGDGRPPTITVNGLLVDVLRRPYPNVPVAIGNVVTSTDARGMFQFTGITPPYDVALRTNVQLTYGWYFVGLTTASPVLQVNTPLGPTRSINYLTLTLANGPATFPPPNEFLGYSWGSIDGNFSTYVRGATDIESPTWYGPTTAAGAAHVLAWMMDAASLPTTYVGYDTTNVNLVDGISSDFALDLARTHPGTASLSGTVTLRSLTTSTHNDVYVALPKTAYIKIVNEDRVKSQTGFDYKVPMGVTGASMVVCAQAGSSIEFPFSFAYKHGLSPGQTGVALTVPDPATPGLPGDGAVVSTSTDFSWTAPPGQQGPALYVLGLELGDSAPLLQVRIVTSKTTARIPKFPAAFGAIVPPSVSGAWWVETTDSYASVDAAATGSGFIDTFDHDGTAIGLFDRDGTHSWSATHGLTTSASP